MNYSRTNPSPRYQYLIEQYRTMHIEGERFLDIKADATFPGLSLPPQARRIKRLIEVTSADSILDYGCGKGRQYEISPFRIMGAGEWPSIVEYWDVSEVHCYDPCYLPFSTLPQGQFDGVIATDVLEHCPEEDIEWILHEIFSFARRFVFANIACYPAKKRLPAGENAHCTIQSVEWWENKIESVVHRYPSIEWEIWVKYMESGKGVDNKKEIRLGK